MKLLNFIGVAGEYRLGVKTARGVVDVKRAAEGEVGVPQSLASVIDGAPTAVQALRAFVDGWPGPGFLPEASLTLGPCVAAPEKIFCVGLNYGRHAEETGAALPEVPVLFSKFNSALTGAGSEVPLPKTAFKYDYEVELGFVIGREARDVPAERALDYVLGYCTVNDLTARDLQKRTSQWLLGKSLEKFMPIGPYLVTADEVADPQDLGLRSWVNGDLRQDSNTSDMIFGVAEIIAYISQYLTLRPGDVITTGTPEGVLLGMSDPDWLEAGDEVTVEVEGLGRNSVRLVAA